MQADMPSQRQHVRNLIESSRCGCMAAMMIVLATAGFLLGVEVAPAHALLPLSARLAGVAMEMVVRGTKSFYRRNAYSRALQMDRVSGLQRGVCSLRYISHAPGSVSVPQPNNRNRCRECGALD